MADEQGSGVDPRFNPAFQRGFDPSTPVAEYEPAGAQASEQASVQARVAAAPGDATAAAGAVAPVGGGAADAATYALANGDAEPLVPIDASGVEVGSAASQVPATRNPWLIGLLVIAVLLVIAGIWLFVSTENQFDSSEVQSQGDYISLTALIEFAPFLALVGGIVIMGVMFIFALRYRGRR